VKGESWCWEKDRHLGGEEDTESRKPCFEREIGYSFIEKKKEKKAPIAKH